MANPDLSRKAAKLFTEYKVTLDKGFDWAKEIESAQTEKDLSLELQNFLANPYMMQTKPKHLEKHLGGLHDQSSHGRKGAIQAGFKNWVGEIDGLFESIDKLEEEGFTRGNATHAVFLEAAGFNDKPQIVSQAEFDALEGETIYRGLESEDMITDYQESLVQYAGEGTFGNGTYGSNLISTGIRYAAKSGGNEGTGALRKRVMEMKLKPDANVMFVGKDDSFSNKKMIMANDFLDTYEKSGANREQYDDAEFKLYNDADWTNIAIMKGFDAIQFDVPFSDNDEKYTIILNRGKVVVNGKS